MLSYGVLYLLRTHFACLYITKGEMAGKQGARSAELGATQKLANKIHTLSISFLQEPRAAMAIVTH